MTIKQEMAKKAEDLKNRLIIFTVLVILGAVFCLVLGSLFVGESFFDEYEPALWFAVFLLAVGFAAAVAVWSRRCMCQIKCPSCGFSLFEIMSNRENCHKVNVCPSCGLNLNSEAT